MWLLIIPLVSSKFSFVLLYVRWRCQHDFHIISCSCGLIVKRWVLQVEYDLLGFLDHMSSLPGFWCCSIFVFLYFISVLFFTSLFVLCPFLAIVLYDILRFTRNRQHNGQKKKDKQRSTKHTHNTKDKE